MNIKSMVGKSAVSVALSLSALVSATPASADAVTNVIVSPYEIEGNGNRPPTIFQIASAPGVWISTRSNAAAGPVVDMASLFGNGGNNVTVIYGGSSPKVKRLDVADTSAPGNPDRVQSIILWDDADNVVDPGVMGVNFTSGTSCGTTTKEQAALVAAALYSHRPLPHDSYQGLIYDPTLNKLVVGGMFYCQLY